MVPCSRFPNNNISEARKNCHGTSVASLIGARGDNNVGLRGMADQSQIEYISWGTYSTSWESYVNERTGRIDSGQYLEMIKALVDDGCRVINCSWGYPYLSKREFVKTEIVEDLNWFDKLGVAVDDWLKPSPYDFPECTQAYQAHLKEHDVCQRMTAIECIRLIAELHQSNDDFIIVQGAGNGIDSGAQNTGVDARYGGYFCAVEQGVFDSLPERGALSKKGITYQTIKDHIIIVSSTSPTRENGRFLKCDYANSGPTVDIYAPGDSLFVATSESDSSYATDFGGTSGAAPIVTGCVAYIWSTNNDLSYAEVKKLLIDKSEAATMKRNGETSEIRMVNIGNYARTLTTQTSTVQGQDTHHTNNAQTEEPDNTPTSPSTNNDTNSTSNASTVSDRQAVAEAFCKQYFTQWSYDGSSYTDHESNEADAALKYLKQGSLAWDAYVSSDEDYNSPLYRNTAGFVTDVRSGVVDDHTFHVVIDGIWIQNDPSYFTWDELQQYRHQGYFLVTVDDDCMITDIQVSSRGSVGAAQSGNG